MYQRAIPEQTSGGAEVSLLPGRGRPFLEPCFLFWPQPSLSLSSHLLSMTRKATTPRHMMFLPPTSLGLTPGSLSQGWPLCLALCHTPAISPALPLPVCLVPGHSVSELEPGPLTKGPSLNAALGEALLFQGLDCRAAACFLLLFLQWEDRLKSIPSSIFPPCPDLLSSIIICFCKTVIHQALSL